MFNVLNGISIWMNPAQEDNSFLPSEEILLYEDSDIIQFENGNLFQLEAT